MISDMHIMHNMHIYDILDYCLIIRHRAIMLSEPSHIVRRARKKLQLNQSDFAVSIGKSQGVLSRYESGKVNPPVDIIMRCMHILDDSSAAADIEQIITKIRTLNGDQHIKLRQALNTLLDNCI